MKIGEISFIFAIMGAIIGMAIVLYEAMNPELNLFNGFYSISLAVKSFIFTGAFAIIGFVIGLFLENREPGNI